MQLNNLIWWSGLAFLGCIGASLSMLLGALLRHALHAAVFTARVWRALRTVKHGRLPAMWWQSFTDPCHVAFVPNHGPVYWPGHEGSDAP